MSDIDTVLVDSLKSLDPKRPIREAGRRTAMRCPYFTAREFGAFAALPGAIAVMLTAKSGLGGKFPAET